MLNDVLFELASFCMLFQKSGLKQLAYGKLKKIRQYIGAEVSWSENVKSFLDTSLQENTNVDTRSILDFIRIFCDYPADRFPENEVDEWSAFNYTAIAQCQFDFWH